MNGRTADVFWYSSSLNGPGSARPTPAALANSRRWAHRRAARRERSLAYGALRAAAFCVAALFGAAPAEAQNPWVGEPRIGPILMRDAVEAIESWKRMQRAAPDVQRMNADIEQARLAFFRSAPDTPARAEAEQRFARLLLDKDHFYLALSEGSRDGLRAAQGIGVLSRTLLDGGIPESVQPAFIRWASAVIRAAIPVQHDEAKLRAAMAAQNDLYNEYKAQRDRSEIAAYEQRLRGAAKARDAVDSRIRINQESVAARQADGSFRLHQQQVVALAPQRHLLADRPAVRQPVRALVVEAAADGQQVLECAYGPVMALSDGTPKYETYRFWHAQLPARIDDMLAVREAPLGALDRFDALGSRVVLSACPADNLLAAAAKGPSPDTAQGSPVTAQPTVSEPSAGAAMRRAESSSQRAASSEASQALLAQRARRCDAMNEALQRERDHVARIAPERALSARNRLVLLEQRWERECGR